MTFMKGLTQLFSIVFLLLLSSCGGGTTNSGATANNREPSVFSTITWPDFPTEAFAESEPQQVGDPTSEPLAASFVIEGKTDEICQWNTETKSLIFTKQGTCTITVTATQEGYTEKSEDFSVTVSPAKIRVGDWGIFDPGTVGAAISPPLLTDLEPSDATGAWVSTTTSICEVDPSTGAVTGLTLGDCTVRLTLSHDDWTEIVYDYTLPVNVGTIAVSNWGTYGTVTVGAGGVAAAALVGLVPDEVTKSYSTTTGTICNVDPSTGEVTGLDAGTCTINLALSKTDYTDKSNEYTITVNPGVIVVNNWGSYSGVTVGGAVGTAPSLTGVVTPSDASKVYTTSSGDICSVDRDTGAVTGLDGGTCGIKVTLSRQGYTDKVNTYSLTVTKGTIAITGWGTYGTVTVGTPATPAPPLTDLNPSSVTKSYTSNTSTICTVVEGTGAVTGIDDGTCEIDLALSKTGYTNKTNRYSLTVNEGTIAVSNWGTYGAVTVGTAATPAPALAGFNPSDATKSYTSNTSSICTVVEGTGAVTGIDDGTCEIDLTLSKTGFANKTNRYSFTVNEGTIAITGWGDYGPVKVGTAATVAPALVDPVPRDVTKAYVSKTSSICEVNNVGAITGLDAGTCTIGLTLSKTGFTDKTHEYSLTVAAGTITVSAIVTYLTVTVGTAATQAPVLAQLVPEDATKNYASTTPSICEVNNVGAVTGLTAGACKITMTLSKMGYTDKTHEYTVTVNAGTIALTGWGTYGAVTVGTSATAAPALVELEPSTATLSYSSNTSTICTVVEGTGAVTGIDAGTCEIDLTLSKIGYTNKTNRYSFTVNAGTIAVDGWGTYSAVTVGGSAGTAPSLSGLVPQNATKSYTTTTGTLCDVNSSTGAVTGKDDGTCTVRLALNKTGYTEKTHNYSVTINEGTFSSITWPTFPSTATAATTTEALGQPTSTPAAGGFTTAKVSGDCTWNNAARTIAFTGATTCVIGVTASKTGYTTKTQNFEVTPGLNTLAISGWGTYSAITVGGAAATAPPLSGLNPTDPTKTYTSNTSTICTVVEGTGAVTGIDDGNCVIRLTLTKTGYNTRTHDYSITVNEGTIAVDGWGSYGAATVGTAATPAPNLTGLVPSNATKSYTSNTSTVCTVVEGTGAVTGVTAGSCEIDLTLSKTGYANKTNRYTLTVNAGAVVATNWGAYGTVTVGAGAVTAPSITDLNPSDAGKSYASATQSVCTVITNTGAVTGVDGGTCNIDLTLTKAGFTTKVQRYSFTVNDGNNCRYRLG